jgi:hypothetical protein
MNGQIIWVAQAEQQPTILGVIDLKNIGGQIDHLNVLPRQSRRGVATALYQLTPN